MSGPLQEIARHLSPSDIVLELVNLSESNPDGRNDFMVDVAAHMVLPLGTYVREREEFAPNSLKLTWDRDKTVLEVEQYNQSNRYEFATREIHERANKIAQDTAASDAHIIIVEQNGEREVDSVYNKLSDAKENKRAIEKHTDFTVHLKSLPMG